MSSVCGSELSQAVLNGSRNPTWLTSLAPFPRGMKALQATRLHMVDPFTSCLCVDLMLRAMPDGRGNPRWLTFLAPILCGKKLHGPNMKAQGVLLDDPAAWIIPSGCV